MNHKFKPAAKSDIRERAERKFRARGSLNFHLLLVLVGAVLLIYSLPYLWATRFSFTGFQYAIPLFSALCTTGALHFIRYYYRHGRGRDRHEAETKARIARQMRGADPDEAEELEELVRLQMDDKLKNKRLAWRHLSLFLGIMSVSMILNAAKCSRIYDLAIGLSGKRTCRWLQYGVLAWGRISYVIILPTARRRPSVWRRSTRRWPASCSARAGVNQIIPRVLRRMTVKLAW